MKTTYWLAELNQYDTPKLEDGPHDRKSGAEKALEIRKQLGMAKDRRFAIAKVMLSEPTGKSGRINKKAIATLNSIGLKP